MIEVARLCIDIIYEVNTQGYEKFLLDFLPSLHEPLATYVRSSLMSFWIPDAVT